MKKIKPKAKMGRPTIIDKIKWNEFDKLCFLQCTEVEIASWFKCSVDSIERAVKKFKDMTFAEYYQQKKGKGQISLRRAQMQLALAGDKTMLIWLGKNMLGQKDKMEFGGDEDSPISITVEGVNLAKLHKGEKKKPDPGSV